MARAWGPRRALCPCSWSEAQGQRQCCPHLPGFLFLEVLYLLAEHVGAGPVLSGSGLPLLVVVHGLLYGKEPHYLPRGLPSPAEWPTVSPAQKLVIGESTPCRQSHPANQSALGGEGL